MIWLLPSGFVSGKGGNSQTPDKKGQGVRNLFIKYCKEKDNFCYCKIDFGILLKMLVKAYARIVFCFCILSRWASVTKLLCRVLFRPMATCRDSVERKHGICHLL